jgi:hypothetical protein
MFGGIANEADGNNCENGDKGTKAHTASGGSG